MVKSNAARARCGAAVYGGPTFRMLKLAVNSTHTHKHLNAEGAEKKYNEMNEWNLPETTPNGCPPSLASIRCSSATPQLLLYLVFLTTFSRSLLFFLGWPSPQSLEHIMRPLFLWLLVTLQNPNIARKQNIKHSRQWLRRPTKKKKNPLPFFLSHTYIYIVESEPECVCSICT